MYTLMFFKSPFNLGEKLAQINANYKIPSNAKFSKEIINLLQRMLTRDPRERVDTGEVWSIIDSLKDKMLMQSNLGSGNSNENNV